MALDIKCVERFDCIFNGYDLCIKCTDENNWCIKCNNITQINIKFCDDCHCQECGCCKEEKEYFACTGCMYKKTKEYVRAHWEDERCGIYICKVCLRERENTCKCTPYDVLYWYKTN